jgi:hypothetical protein
MQDELSLCVTSAPVSLNISNSAVWFPSESVDSIRQAHHHLSPPILTYRQPLLVLFRCSQEVQRLLLARKFIGKAYFLECGRKLSDYLSRPA